jgi:hypothetical protein
MSDQTEYQTNDQFEGLFGKPPLLAGEDSERYQRLCNEVIRELKPEGIFEWVNARDQVDKIWEEQRYRRSSVALIDGAVGEAFRFYVSAIAAHKLTTGISPSTTQFFSADPNDKKKVNQFLKRHAVTFEQIQAKAMQITGGTLQMFDRMIVNRETSRRGYRKERAALVGAKIPKPSAQAEKVET